MSRRVKVVQLERNPQGSAGPSPDAILHGPQPRPWADGMILVETPWGRWWSYLEVGLSERTYGAVLPRCAKCGSPNRMDNLPVLVVCRDYLAEGSFHLTAAD